MEFWGGDVKAVVVTAVVLKLQAHGVAATQEASESHLAGFDIGKVEERRWGWCDRGEQHVKSAGGEGVVGAVVWTCREVRGPAWWHSWAKAQQKKGGFSFVLV